MGCVGGQARFGPDVEWLPGGTVEAGLDYAVDPRRQAGFEADSARAFRLDGRKVEAALNGINLGSNHQEIADRSEQCLQANPANPVNPASSMGWLSLAMEL